MSKTMSVGVHDETHYTYLASEMAECLTTVADRGEVKIDSFPKAVLMAAQNFFSSVLEAIGRKVPKNPPASINDYVMACEYVKRIKRWKDASCVSCNTVLKMFGRFVNSLNKPRQLLSHEIVTAKELVTFFEALASKGEERSYEKVMGEGGDDE